MTNKQKAKLKRNAKILEEADYLTLEEIAAKYNISVAHVYRIIQLQKLYDK